MRSESHEVKVRLCVVPTFPLFLVSRRRERSFITYNHGQMFGWYHITTMEMEVFLLSAVERFMEWRSTFLCINVSFHFSYVQYSI